MEPAMRLKDRSELYDTEDQYHYHMKSTVCVRISKYAPSQFNELRTTRHGCI